MAKKTGTTKKSTPKESPNSEKKEFYYIFYAPKNLFAYNCDQLAQMMWDDKEVAKAHLYYEFQNDEFYDASIECTLRKAGLITKANQIQNILKVCREKDTGITTYGVICCCYVLSGKIPIRANEFIYLHKPEELPQIWRRWGLEYNSANTKPPLVKDPLFPYWLSHFDAPLASKLRHWQTFAGGPYEIAYQLFPMMSYDFHTKESSDNLIMKPHQIGNLINEQIAEYIKSADKVPAKDLSDFNLNRNGRIIQFLRARSYFGDYAKKLQDLLYNRQPWQNGAYGPNSGYALLYSAVKSLGHKPWYEFSDGQRIDSLEELNKISPFQIFKAFKTGHLDAWIASFFQGDPGAYFLSEREFAQESEKYLKFIASLDRPDFPLDYIPLNKYNQALKDIDATAATYAKLSRPGIRVQLLRCLFVPLAALAFILAFVAAIKTPLSPYVMWGTLTVIAVALAIFIKNLWPVYERVPGYAYVTDIATPNYSRREMEALVYAFSSSKTKKRGDERIAQAVNSYKRRKSQDINSRFGYSLGAIATAAVIIFAIQFIGRHSSESSATPAETVENVSEAQAGADSVAATASTKNTKKSKKTRK